MVLSVILLEDNQGYGRLVPTEEHDHENGQHEARQWPDGPFGRTIPGADALAGGIDGIGGRYSSDGGINLC